MNILIYNLENINNETNYKNMNLKMMIYIF